MQTMIAHSAIRRGLQLFAGMLVGHTHPTIHMHEAAVPDHDLVSWCSEARTRRGDELARRQLLESVQDA